MMAPSAMSRMLLVVMLSMNVSFSTTSHAQSAGGAAKKELPLYPLDAVVLDSNTAIVVDRNLPGLWRFQSSKLEVLAQGSPRFREPLNAARCIAVDSQKRILVGDSSTREIYRLDEQNRPIPLTGGKIGTPVDIATRSDGTILVADLETRNLLSISEDGKTIASMGTFNARGVFVDSKDQIWIVSQDPQQLQVIGADGKARAIVPKPVFEFPHQVVVNKAGEAFVSDGYKKAIWKVVEGKPPEILVVGPPLDNPVGLAIQDDKLYVIDPRTRQVYRLNESNKLDSWFTIQKERN